LADPGRTYEGGRGTRVEVTESNAQRLRLRRTYPAGTGRADPHVHLDFAQRWTVVEGHGRVAIGGDESEIGPGETIGVDRGTEHRDPFNPGGEPLVVDWLIEPQNEFIEAFIDAYVWLLGRDRLNDKDEFPMLQLMTILHATRAQSFAVGPPRIVQRAFIPLAAALGRLRGYRPRYG
jgi:mannose-6-phosphate isomerase-like protein (cupin superfamily)